MHQQGILHHAKAGQKSVVQQQAIWTQQDPGL
jgi:hypothetical protein